MKSARFLFTLVFSTLAVLGVASERAGTGSELAAIVSAPFWEGVPSGGLSSREAEAPVVFLPASAPSLDVLPREQGLLTRVTARKLTSSIPLALQRGHAQAATSRVRSLHLSGLAFARALAEARDGTLSSRSTGLPPPRYT
jgi:hypothetical protein